MLNNLQQMHLKQLQKEQFIKQQQQKLLIELQKISKTLRHNNSEIIINDADKEIHQEIHQYIHLRKNIIMIKIIKKI